MLHAHVVGHMVVHCKKSLYDVYIGRPSKWGNPLTAAKKSWKARCWGAGVLLYLVMEMSWRNWLTTRAHRERHYAILLLWG